MLPLLMHIDPSMDAHVLNDEEFDVDTKRVVDVIIGWATLSLAFFGAMWWYWRYRYMTLPSSSARFK